MATAKIPIKAVLFDFWNTLVYDIPELEQKRAVDRCERITRILQQSAIETTLTQVSFAYNGAGKKILEKAQKNMAITIREQIKLMLEILKIDNQSINIDLLEEAYNRPVTNIICPIVPGAQQLIERLSRKYKLGLISNTERTAGQYLLSAYQDVLKRFSFAFFSDERKIRKPNREAFKITATELQTDPAECVMIGDKLDIDILPAIDCGMKAILFSDPAIGKKEAYYPQVTSLEEIPRALEIIS
jgi:FMN phosphatase YigB (HAD superfamily)